jgi:hypothetical protein
MIYIGYLMVAGAGCVEAPTINIAAQSSSTLQETGTD